MTHFHHYIIQSILTVIKNLGVPSINPSPHFTHWQPLIFLLPPVLPFPDCYIVGTPLYVAFSSWFLSLSIYLSDQISLSVVSNSLRPHESQHTRPPCPSPTPGVYSNSCPLSQWYHPTISSSVIPFSSCLQSYLASGSFLISQFFASGGQSIGVLASASVLPMNIQNWFPSGLTGLPCSPRDAQESSPTPQFENINYLALSFLYGPTLTSIHDY